MGGGIPQLFSPSQQMQRKECLSNMCLGQERDTPSKYFMRTGRHRDRLEVLGLHLFLPGN